MGEPQGARKGVPRFRGVRAAETGSFAMADRVPSMSSPGVGKHVAALEERLGVQLLARTTRRHGVTEAVSVKPVLTDQTVDVAGERFDAVVRIGTLDDSSLAPSAALPPSGWRPARRLRDDILRGTTAATGFGHAARVARLVEDMLDSSRTGAWKPAAGWPEQG